MTFPERIDSELIRQTAKESLGFTCNQIALLPASGSHRKYYRLTSSDSKTIIAAVNSEVRENRAFIEFSQHFAKHGLPVPKVLSVHPDETLYFITDLGDTTLYHYLQHEGKSNPTRLKLLYRKAADYLLDFQFCEPPDYTKSFPRAAFDRTSMMWDLNYFKYYFLKLTYVPFDEQKLENDFIKYCDTLSETPSHYFLYRDFQSRNIMLVNDDLAFIDYQGGRRGALPYDLASLLYDAKANLSDDFRQDIFDYYCQQLDKRQLASPGLFRDLFHYFVLLRIMQAFGAYGYRGYYEKKEHFLQSVPLAASNLKSILERINFQNEYPELSKVWNHIASKFSQSESSHVVSDKLHVQITSFSFKKGYPSGHPEHGGGFVFDCRALPNPGREERFSKMTGLDDDVIRFLEDQREVSYFIDASADLICLSLDNYLGRGFNQLAISFGCTGGQHRSVYCASKIERELRIRYGNDIHVSVLHRELQ